MSDKSKEAQTLLEIQDDLMRQKNALLKDIIVINKEKIKEMEEIYDIKNQIIGFKTELANMKEKMDKKGKRKKRDIVGKK